ncbi:MAG: hypothetical protein KDM63_03330 [Verrucomicrobiae bacterium]|nr:hypothetical protein [Verrucomicrobiae bacterium]
MRLTLPNLVRRKGPVKAETLPPACFQLAPRTDDFLDRLRLFDRSRLVIRGEGLTICRDTAFGDFPTGKGQRRDLVSGLALAPERVTGIYLFRERGMPPAFEIALMGEGFRLAIIPASSESARQTLRAVLHDLSAERCDGHALREAGAAMWLDESLNMVPMSARAGSAITRVQEGGGFRFSVWSDGFDFACEFEPQREDRDGSVLRWSDRSQQSTAHFDLRNQSLRCPSVLTGPHRNMATAKGVIPEAALALG